MKMNLEILTELFNAGEVISEAYVLEYGNDCLEMHTGAVERGERALIIDDLVATGGTLSAAIRLLGVILIFTLFHSAHLFKLLIISFQFSIDTYLTKHAYFAVLFID